MNAQKLESLRKQKNLFFKTSPKSPIPRILRKRFTKLNYFKFNPDFVLKAQLTKNESQETIEIGNSGDYTEHYLIFGKLIFEYQNQNYSLHLFQSPKNPDYLWLPFKDLTNKTETYEAGRYLEFYLSKLKPKNLEINFNQAYNPYCAYNSAFICPLIPPNNDLKIEIRAGEKRY